VKAGPLYAELYETYLSSADVQEPSQ
jgi:hypothetical protein